MSSLNWNAPINRRGPTSGAEEESTPFAKRRAANMAMFMMLTMLAVAALTTSLVALTMKQSHGTVESLIADNMSVGDGFRSENAILIGNQLFTEGLVGRANRRLEYVEVELVTQSGVVWSGISLDASVPTVQCPVDQLFAAKNFSVMTSLLGTAVTVSDFAHHKGEGTMSLMTLPTGSGWFVQFEMKLSVPTVGFRIKTDLIAYNDKMEYWTTNLSGSTLLAGDTTSTDTPGRIIRSNVLFNFGGNRIGPQFTAVRTGTTDVADESVEFESMIVRLYRYK